MYQAYIWELWHDLIEPYATLMPYMVGVGNHEQDHIFGGSKDPSGAPGDGWHPWWGNYLDDSGGECGVPMFYRFHMPDNGNGLWWYVVSLTFYHFYHYYHALLMSSLVSRSCSKPCTYPSGWEHSKMLLFSQSLKVRAHIAAHLYTKDEMNSHDDDDDDEDDEDDHLFPCTHQLATCLLQ